MQCANKCCNCLLYRKCFHLSCSVIIILWCKLAISLSLYLYFFGAQFQIQDNRFFTQQFDACASWWTQGPDAALQVIFMAHDWFSIVKDSYFIMLYFLIFSVMHASLEKKSIILRWEILFKKKKKTRISYKKIVMAYDVDKSLDPQV